MLRKQKDLKTNKKIITEYRCKSVLEPYTLMRNLRKNKKLKYQNKNK